MTRLDSFTDIFSQTLRIIVIRIRARRPRSTSSRSSPSNPTAVPGQQTQHPFLTRTHHCPHFGIVPPEGLDVVVVAAEVVEV